MFPRDRFQVTLTFFHAVDNLAAPFESGYELYAKFQPPVEHASGVFRHHFTPNKQFSVYERLVGATTHMQQLQY